MKFPSREVMAQQIASDIANNMDLDDLIDTVYHLELDAMMGQHLDELKIEYEERFGE